MRPMLNYYGGKWSSGDWIIEHFPEHEIYVEVFGGGASVMLKKKRSKREVINDIDDEIVNLYQVMRDHYAELHRRCELTPHSRKEYKMARDRSEDPIEQARRTIIKSYFGIGDSVFNENGMRSSKTSNTCVATSWFNWHQQMWQIAERFQGVTIESLSWSDLLEKYDSPTTLFYLDPPYVKATRNSRHAYRFDFEDKDHVALIDAIQKLKGFVLISGYDHEIYTPLPWKKVTRDFKTNNKKEQTETLWLCPKTQSQQTQMGLF